MATGKALLKNAYIKGNEKAADYMIHYSIVKSKKEIDAEVMIGEEDLNSQLASSAGLLADGATNSRRH